MDEFGLTNNKQELSEIIAFRDAAIADGWTHKPTYGSEAEDCACTLDKEGFQMSILTRDGTGGKYKFQCKVSIWGPDELVIHLKGPVYNWDEIKDGLRYCGLCGRSDVDTQRYSFAGRCCAECRPEMAKRHEYPGWTN